MACTGDSVVLLFSENYEIHVLKTKRSSLLQMVWAVLGLRLKVYLKWFKNDGLHFLFVF